MDKELAFATLFVFSSVVYFPIVEALPTRVECTLALATAVALHFSDQYTKSETKVLLRLANLYHLYLLVVAAILQTIPMDYIVTITQMILSVVYAYNRLGMLELVQLVILCFYPLVTADNTFRMALAVVVYGSETHFGKEHELEYLCMVILPILRLPIIMARLYTAFVLACRAYVVYLKRNEVVKVEDPPPEEEDEESVETPPEQEEEVIEEPPKPPSPPPPPRRSKRTTKKVVKFEQPIPEKTRQIDVSILDVDDD